MTSVWVAPTCLDVDCCRGSYEAGVDGVDGEGIVCFRTQLGHHCCVDVCLQIKLWHTKKDERSLVWVFVEWSEGNDKRIDFWNMDLNKYLVLSDNIFPFPHKCLPQYITSMLKLCWHFCPIPSSPLYSNSVACCAKYSSFAVLSWKHTFQSTNTGYCWRN